MALAALYLPAVGGAALAASTGAAAGALLLLDRLLPDRPAGSTAARPRHARLVGAAWLGVAVAVLLGACAGAAATAARVAERDADPLADLTRRTATVRVEVVITDDPRPVRGSGGRPSVVTVPARLRLLWTDRMTVRSTARLLLFASDQGWRDLLPGERVEAAGKLSPARGGDLRAAVLSATGPPTRLGEPPWPQRAAGRLRAGLQRACEPLPDEPGGLLPGLVIGDTSRLLSTVAEDFRAVGLTHLVAVSGANCAIVVGAVLLSLRWMRAGPRLTAAAAVLALVGFVVLARPSPSVLRAAVMGALALVALASGRSRAAVPALAAAVLALVVVDPELAGSAGFALSVVATAGLLVLAPGWRDALRRRGVPSGVAEAVAVPAAAQAACAPLVAGLYGTVSIAAVPANVLAVPAVAPATVLGVLAAAVSPFWSAGAQILAQLGSWPAWWLVLIARYGAEVPAGTLPWPAGAGGGLLLAGLVAAVLLAGRWVAVRRLALAATLAVVAGALPVRVLTAGWPPPGWLVVACSVGQGDAVALPAGRGQAVVVDAGPEPAATDRCLRRLGVHHVPLLVITHFHADHVGGLDGVFRGRSVGAVVTTSYPEPVAGRTAVAVATATNRVRLDVPSAGWTVSVGAVQLTVLGPTVPARGTRSDANNNSLVLRANVGGRVVLLTGDAEVEQQRSLLAAYGPAGIRADVVKIAHHGSAFQDEEFLAAARPAVALVSVGADNDYGHPNAAVLGRLSRDGARVVRTDRDGDVAAVADGARLAIVVRGPDQGRPP